MLRSEERANELAAASYGDVTSTGRILSSGTETIPKEELQAWARTPLPTRTRDYHNNHFNSDKWDT